MLEKTAAKKKFLQERAHLWWWVADVSKLSDEAMLEGVLNYGEWDDVKAVFELLGIKRAATIFKKQTTGRKRNNYRPKTFNYFKLYFKAHA